MPWLLILVVVLCATPAGFARAGVIQDDLCSLFENGRRLAIDGAALDLDAVARLYGNRDPDWTVPLTIAAKDLLPKIRKEPGFLAAESFEVFDGWSADAERLNPLTVDWSRLGPKRFPYKLRQRPGPQNALGRIKFMLPNPYHIYLHDTPNRQLFARTSRSFSSGCVRLSQPFALADHLLRTAPETQAELQAKLASGETGRINPPVFFPVYFTYFTAWSNDRGVDHFREDVYDRDQALYYALIDQLVTQPPQRLLESAESN